MSLVEVLKHVRAYPFPVRYSSVLRVFFCELEKSRLSDIQNLSALSLADTLAQFTYKFGLEESFFAFCALSPKLNSVVAKVFDLHARTIGLHWDPFLILPAARRTSYHVVQLEAMKGYQFQSESVALAFLACDSQYSLDFVDA